ncbi:chorion class CB protein PC404-like [Maniola jurtina]|uniref:chorion class CB protein PC404-like n=1 Tax=Maniola jurtina TaxID=191418 RepID=UPI001E68AF1A|nr:chorion class CB protein PC404-like [Maniola jurtina]XP_045782612.1 chorion class CB protein PC404-like [Maniola jurtina]
MFLKTYSIIVLLSNNIYSYHIRKMVAKAVLLLCAQALFAQCISSQCLRGYNGIVGDGLAGPFAAPWNAPYIAEAPLAAIRAPGSCGAAPLAAEYTGFRPSNGGGFPVTSVSPMTVTGITMTSENVYEGPITVTGAVPFLGAVALEGGLPTVGAGGVSYGCGNGNVGMVSEDIAPFTGPYGAGVVGGYGYGPLAPEAAIAGRGYGYGYNRGCGGALF